MEKIITYTASNIRSINNKPIRVRADFALKLDIVNEVAKKHGFIVLVTSSGRLDTKVPGAIVTPAEKGNHLVYGAIDFNMKLISTGEYFNSVKLGDGTGLDEKFIAEATEKSGLRWGGKFKKKDAVHFDDNLNHANPDLWKQYYDEIHK